MAVDQATLERLRATVWPALEQAYGLPKGTLYAVSWWETRGTWSDAPGGSGSRGIFQLTPTALAQIKIDTGITHNPDNAYSASAGAAALLSRYLRLFGQPALMIAAYNAGEGKVRSYVRQVQSSGRGALPGITVDYVQNVMPVIGGMQP
jgi:soluble lytic murein transglycosylase-like protein